MKNHYNTRGNAKTLNVVENTRSGTTGVNLSQAKST